MDTVIQVAPLSAEAARSLTDEVKRDAEALWFKLVELYEGKAWKALGHNSWGDYFKVEFGQSRRRGYELLTAGKVLGELSAEFRTLPKNEGQANELAPLLREPEQLRDAWAEVVDLYPEPTAADIREVVRSTMDVHYSSATDEWATPQDIFDELDGEFGFTLDVCASPSNAKCSRFFDSATDGLAQDWTGVCWMNPPYGDVIPDWIGKARASALAGATVVCLVPARVDTGWWWENCRHGEVRFLRGRLKFGGSPNSAPFPSAVVVFTPDVGPKTVYWER